MANRAGHLLANDLALHRHLQSISARTGGISTAVEARAFGAVDGQIRRLIAAGLWVKIRRGVYAEAAVMRDRCSHDIRAAAAIAALRGDPVVSHVSGLRVLELPLPWGVDDRIHLTRRPPRYANAPEDTVIHVAEYRDEDVTVVRGIPVLGGARLVLDCWQTLCPADALAVADAALRAKLTCVEDLRDLDEHRVRQPRSAGFELLVERADPLAESWFESSSRWWLLEGGLPRPVLQHPFLDQHTGARAFADMWFPEFSTIGEADGESKYQSRQDLVGETASGLDS